MILTPPEKKLIKFMKTVQRNLENYIVFNESMKNACGVHCLAADDVAKQFNNGHYWPSPVTGIELKLSLDSLVNNGLIRRTLSTDSFQVNLQGWYCEYLMAVELRNQILKNVLLPVIVSIITTVITMVITAG